MQIEGASKVGSIDKRRHRKPPAVNLCYLLIQAVYQVHELLIAPTVGDRSAVRVELLAVHDEGICIHQVTRGALPRLLH